MADVKAALTTAANRAWWVGARKPQGYTGDGSEITVPVNLIKAVAWQESGWQSTIIACDGGIGTMQVMPGTATWMNDRFGTSHDVDTLAGNTALGAEYLEWLIMYFGLYYFGSFDLDVTAPVGANGATMRLLDVVVAGYNVGPGAVEVIVDDPGTDYLKIPNQRYVDNVVALMSNCVCLSY
jgi:soluble lytic murein transglycosylase-like protein